jgi:hypothetical protein
MPGSQRMKTSAQIVQTSFKVRIPWADYERRCQQVAEHIAAVPGLIWKGWVVSEARSEAGGVYLFESKESSEAFLEGPIVSMLENDPAFEELRIKTFDVLEEPSLVTGFRIPAQV